MSDSNDQQLYEPLPEGYFTAGLVPVDQVSSSLRAALEEQLIEGRGFASARGDDGELYHAAVRYGWVGIEEALKESRLPRYVQEPPGLQWVSELPYWLREESPQAPGRRWGWGPWLLAVMRCLFDRIRR